MKTGMQTWALSPDVHIALWHNRPDTWHFRNLIHKKKLLLLIHHWDIWWGSSQFRGPSCQLCRVCLVLRKKWLNSKIHHSIMWLNHSHVLIKQMFYSKWFEGNLLAPLRSRLGALWAAPPLWFQSHSCSHWSMIPLLSESLYSWNFTASYCSEFILLFKWKTEANELSLFTNLLK